MEPAETIDKTASKSLGQTFAAERERQGLARTDVAQRLHMSAYQIEALETGDFNRLPRGTFLRGFVRNYAKLLGLAPDSVLPLLDQGLPRDKRPGIVVPTQNIRFDPIGDRLSNPYVKAAVLAVVAVSLGFAAMYWWLFIRPTTPAQVRKAEPAAAPPVVAVAPPEPFIQARPAAPAVPMPEPAKAEAAKADAKKAEPPKVAAPADGSVLKFRFKGQSWVEIRDGRGRLLFSKLNAPGSETEVTGKPPFNVTVGNAPEVQLFYNDHEFDLEPHTKVSVARFTVE